MNDRTLINRLLSPAGFGLVLIFFLMPFFTVSCGVDEKSQIKSTFSGLALATGSQPKVEDQPPDQAAKLLSAFPDSFHPEVLVVLAAIAVFAGMVIGFIRASAARHVSSLALAVVAVALLVLEIRQAPARVVDALATLYDPANPGPALEWSIHPRYGFWLAVGLLVLIAGYHSALLVQTARAMTVRSATGPPPPPPYAEAADYAPWPT
jgi:hypothetical protein